jgi:hypothetical protein
MELLSVAGASGDGMDEAPFGIEVGKVKQVPRARLSSVAGASGVVGLTETNEEVPFGIEFGDVGELGAEGLLFLVAPSFKGYREPSERSFVSAKVASRHGFMKGFARNCSRM